MRNTNQEVRCADCGAAVASRDKKRRARFCDDCRTRRRRDGQLRRWERDRRLEPRLRKGVCAWDGCRLGLGGRPAVVPARRRYCCLAHYHAARTGQPGRRTGRVVSCDVCAQPIGYMRPSRVRRARRHYCAAHIGDYRRANPPRPRTRYYGIVCGHEVSKPGNLRCRKCYSSLASRGGYETEAMRRIAEVEATFTKGRRVITNEEWARRANVSLSSLYGELARRKTRRAPKPPRDPAPHDHAGTAVGYRQHIKCGETPCADCRNGNRRRRRERYRERKLGLPPAKRVDAARCGTLSGYRAHRRRHEEACPDCRAAERAYSEQRRRRDGMEPKKPAACGTVSGYQRHHRLGERPCDACAEAHRGYMRAYRVKRRSVVLLARRD